MSKLSLDRDVLEAIFKANRATAQKEQAKSELRRESPKKLSARLHVRSMLEQRIKDIMTANSLLIRSDRLAPMLRHTAIVITVDYLNNHQDPVRVFTYELVASSLTSDLGLSDAESMASYVTDKLLEMGHTQLKAETRQTDANVYIVTR